VASLIIKDYPKQISFLQIIENIPKNFTYDISMYIKKQDTTSVLKQLTYHISSSGTEIKTVNENQLDIDVLSKTKEDAKNLRKDIQINNEEVYFLTTIITFYSNNKQELLDVLKNFQSKLYSKQISSSIANFRHLDSYLLSLPLNDFTSKILKTNYRNITTSALANFFPFYNKTIFDEKGIIFGYTKNENKIFNVDIFNNKYLNSNMCVFGSSGSGKSYFTKLILIRHYLMGKEQYVFDPEGEYVSLISSLGGRVINFNDSNTKKFYNILEITKTDIEIYKTYFFIKKVESVTELIAKLCNLTIEDKETVKETIIQAYKEKGITKDIESVYLSLNEGNVFVDKKIKDPSCFPNLIDIKNNVKSKKIANIIQKNIIAKYPIFSENTNILNTNSITVFNTSLVNTKDTIIFFEYFLNNIQLKLKESKQKKNTIIYIDEIWKYICTKEAINLSETIFNMFKTIRKYGGSIVTITQDVSDFFSYEQGNYGKSILNNSGFKMFFKLDFADLEILQKLSIINDDIITKISKLDKGQALMGFKSNSVFLNIKSNEYEDKLIKGGEIIENFSSIK
jgi:type IV secretory pathway VirB4 component